MESEVFYDMKFRRYFVDRTISLVKVLNSVGSGFAVNFTCFCPFHDNRNTKSAKIYKDLDCEVLYCFSEQRMYRSSDALEKLLGISIPKSFLIAWQLVTSEQRDVIYNDYLNLYGYSHVEFNNEGEGISLVNTYKNLTKSSWVRNYRCSNIEYRDSSGETFRNWLICEISSQEI